MSVQQAKPDVAVVGGGPIGLRPRGARPSAGCASSCSTPASPGAWHVAAGMLAPVAEAAARRGALLELGLRAAAGCPAFCAELAEAPAATPGCARPARSSSRATATRPRRSTAWLALRRRLGLRVERLLPTAARRPSRRSRRPSGSRSTSPATTRSTRAGWSRRCARRSRAGGAARACARRPGCVAASAHRRRLADGGELRRARSWSPPGAGGGLGAARPVRPVKGQVLRLRDPHGPGLVERTIRTLDAYLVPRADGRYVLGATMEERGFDTAPTAGGVFELLRDVSEVVPGVLELEVEELLAGLRPATPDNLPAIGAGAEGLVGRPATTATASCSRASPASSSPGARRRGGCPTGRRRPAARGFAGVPA